VCGKRAERVFQQPGTVQEAVGDDQNPACGKPALQMLADAGRAAQLDVNMGHGGKLKRFHASLLPSGFCAQTRGPACT
jgi:hypothetical protein